MCHAAKLRISRGMDLDLGPLGYPEVHGSNPCPATIRPLGSRNLAGAIPRNCPAFSISAIVHAVTPRIFCDISVRDTPKALDKSDWFLFLIASATRMLPLMTLSSEIACVSRSNVCVVMLNSIHDCLALVNSYWAISVKFAFSLVYNAKHDFSNRCRWRCHGH